MKKISLVAQHVGETQGASIDVRRLKTRGYIIQNIITLNKSVNRTPAPLQNHE